MNERAAPLFSIITPAYNAGSKLETTVLSVLAQPSELFEYLVIDGASTDKTRELLELYRHQLTSISEPDTGIYDAMNKGIALAQGKFLYFLGAGDVLRPGALEAVNSAASLENRNQPLLVYGDVYWTPLQQIYAGPFNRFKLAIQNICHQAIFYHHEIFKILGPFDQRYSTLADYVLNMRCFARPDIEIQYIPVVVANFEAGGLSADGDELFFQERARLIQKELGLLPLFYWRIKALHFRARAQRLVKRALQVISLSNEEKQK